MEKPGVFATSGRAFRVFCEHFGKYAALAWKPFVLAYISTFLVGFFTSVFGGPGLAVGILSPILEAFFGALFALACHRLALLGWNEETKRVRLHLARRERLFLFIVLLGYIFIGPQRILIAIRMFDPVSIGSLNPNVLLVLTAILPVIALFIFPRFVYILPAIAEDRERPLVYGVEVGKGVYWRTLCLLVLIGVPIFYISKLMFGPMAVSNNFAPSLIGSIGQQILSYVQAAIIVVAVCDIYRRQSRAPLVQTVLDDKKSLSGST